MPETWGNVNTDSATSVDTIAERMMPRMIDTQEDEAVVNRPGKVTPPRSLRVPDEEWASWHESAKAAGITLTDWLRDAAAEKQAKERRKRR
jgi:hypothetical protein